MLTFISEINNRNHGIIVNSSQNRREDYITNSILHKKMSGVNYFYRPQTIESCKLGPSRLEQ